MGDVGKIKAALIKRTNVEGQELFEPTKYSDVEQFEAFCQKIKDDRSHYDLFVVVF